eukprot:gnl/Chilomastix_cuspidata/589.p1 GENE.gnl/Chilomastix_cuspidata/589~~gnl/Chilomastix_cuspidata/589.p1  ORF type:complete len:1166 (-),score=471.83 gnl/Chilomastix_cuspidata/589:2497-5994(-)
MHRISEAAPPRTLLDGAFISRPEAPRMDSLAEFLAKGGPPPSNNAAANAVDFDPFSFILSNYAETPLSELDAKIKELKKTVSDEEFNRFDSVKRQFPGFVQTKAQAEFLATRMHSHPPSDVPAQEAHREALLAFQRDVTAGLRGVLETNREIEERLERERTAEKNSSVAQLHQEIERAMGGERTDKVVALCTQLSPAELGEFAHKLKQLSHFMLAEAGLSVCDGLYETFDLPKSAPLGGLVDQFVKHRELFLVLPTPEPLRFATAVKPNAAAGERFNEAMADEFEKAGAEQAPRHVHFSVFGQVAREKHRRAARRSRDTSELLRKHPYFARANFLQGIATDIEAFQLSNGYSVVFLLEAMNFILTARQLEQEFRQRIDQTIRQSTFGMTDSSLPAQAGWPQVSFEHDALGAEAAGDVNIYATVVNCSPFAAAFAPNVAPAPEIIGKVSDLLFINRYSTGAEIEELMSEFSLMMTQLASALAVLKQVFTEPLRARKGDSQRHLIVEIVGAVLQQILECTSAMFIGQPGSPEPIKTFVLKRPTSTAQALDTDAPPSLSLLSGPIHRIIEHQVHLKPPPLTQNCINGLFHFGQALLLLCDPRRSDAQCNVAEEEIISCVFNFLSAAVISVSTTLTGNAFTLVRSLSAVHLPGVKVPATTVLNGRVPITRALFGSSVGTRDALPEELPVLHECILRATLRAVLPTLECDSEVRRTLNNRLRAFDLKPHPPPLMVGVLAAEVIQTLAQMLLELNSLERLMHSTFSGLIPPFKAEVARNCALLSREGAYLDFVRDAVLEGCRVVSDAFNGAHVGLAQFLPARQPESRFTHPDCAHEEIKAINLRNKTALRGFAPPEGICREPGDLFRLLDFDETLTEVDNAVFTRLLVDIHTTRLIVFPMLTALWGGPLELCPAEVCAAILAEAREATLFSANPCSVSAQPVDGSEFPNRFPPLAVPLPPGTELARIASLFLELEARAADLLVSATASRILSDLSSAVTSFGGWRGQPEESFTAALETFLSFLDPHECARFSVAQAMNVLPHAALTLVEFFSGLETIPPSLRASVTLQIRARVLGAFEFFMQRFLQSGVTIYGAAFLSFFQTALALIFNAPHVAPLPQIALIGEAAKKSDKRFASELAFNAEKLKERISAHGAFLHLSTLGACFALAARRG